MYYGIDLHSDNLKGAVLGDNGNEPKILRSSIEPEYLGKFLKKLTKEDYIAVEASTNTFWFYDQVKPLVKECYVIDPGKFALVSNSMVKTDKRDAVSLVRMLKYSVNTGEPLHTVYVPVEDVREIRSLFTSRNLVKANITRLKNRIHSLLKQNGHKQEKESLDKYGALDKILQLDLSETVKVQLTILFKQMEGMIEDSEVLRKTIMVKGKIFEKEIKLLTSIKGISPFTAIGIMSDVADINRFPNAKHFCSYLRSAPKVDSSNQTTKIGKVNKCSRHVSMELLIESIPHFLSCKRYDFFYERKCKGKSKGKARVAIARKVMVAIYYMLKRKELFHWVEKDCYEKKVKEYEKFLKKVA
jgi:transposase